MQEGSPGKLSNCGLEEESPSGGLCLRDAVCPSEWVGTPGRAGHVPVLLGGFHRQDMATAQKRF